MRNSLPPVLLAVLAAVLLGACASSGEALPVPQTADGMPAIPEDSIEAVVVQDNGDGKVNPEDGEAPTTYYKLFSW